MPSSAFSIAALVCAIACFVLMIADCVLVLANRHIEADVQQRQEFINHSLQVNQVGNALVQALVAAANGKDSAIEDALHDYGFATPPPAGSASPQSVPGSAGH